MENNEREGFNYTYSAKEQDEIKKIRNKYEPAKQGEDKLERLRRLDASATKGATVASLVAGILGALILGAGMSLIMTDIGEILGLIGTLSLIVGVLMGVFGMILVCLAYPIYNKCVSIKRRKLAPEIIRLSDELMK